MTTETVAEVLKWGREYCAALPDPQRVIVSQVFDRIAAAHAREVGELALQWRPIESAPYYKRILVLMPQFDVFSSAAWIGVRSGVGNDGAWSLATPITYPPKEEGGIRRQAWVSELPDPIGWMPLPDAMGEPVREVLR